MNILHTEASQDLPKDYPPRVNILHVDDDRDSLMFTKLFLEKSNPLYSVTSIDSPETALEKLEKNRFDCILSDYKMPHMNGLELARKIRENSDIPIILYTGQGSEEVAEQAFKSGVDDYLRKEPHPSHYKVLAQQILNTVERYRSRRLIQVEHDLGLALAQSESLSEALDICLEAAITASGLDSGGVYLVDDRGGLILAAHIGSSDYAELVTSYSEGNEMAGLAKKGDPLYATYDELELKTKSQPREDLKAFACLPVPKDGNVIGYMMLSSHALEHVPYYPRDTLRTITSHMGSAITQVKQREELERSERRYRKLVEGSSLPISVTVGNIIVYVNQKRLELTGHTRAEELIGSNTLENVHPEDREYIISRLEAMAEGRETPPTSTFRLKHVDGSVIQVEDYLSEAVWEGERALIHSLIDITERKTAVEALRDSDEWSRALFEGSRDAIFITGIDARFVDVNEAAVTLTGYVREELLGMGILDLHDSKNLLAYNKYFNRILAGEPVTSEAYILRKNGEKVLVEFSNAKINLKGSPYMHTTARDVTSRKNYQENMNALHVHASRLTRLKSVEKVAEATFDAINQVLGYERGSFAVVKKGTLHHTYIEGSSGGTFEMPLDGLGVTVRAVNTGVTQHIADVRLDPDFVQGLGEEGAETRSELAVPVKIKDNVVALINVESTETNAFTDNDRKLLEILAEHVASALYSLELVEKERGLVEKLEAIYDSSTGLSEARNVEDVCDVTITILEKYLNFSWIGVGFVDTDHIEYVRHKGAALESYGWLPLDGKGITVRAVNTGQTQLVRDTRIDPDYLVLHGFQEAYLSELVVPVMVDDEVRFIINLESDVVDGFSEDDCKVVELLARHMEAALKNIKTVDENRRYWERLMALHSHIAHLNQAGSLDEVVIATHEALTRCLGYEVIDIIQVDESVLKDYYPIREYFTLPLEGPGITARAARTGETQLIADTSLDPDYVVGSREKVMRSELTVPVKVEGDVVLLLNVESKSPGVFTEDDKSLVETLAMHISIALDRIRSVEERYRYEEKLMALHSNINKLNEAESLDDVFIATHEASTRCLGYDILDIMKVEEGYLKIILPENDFKLPLDGPGVTTRAARTGETQLVTDTSLDLDFVAGGRDSIMCSELSVPVKVEGGVEYLLNVESRRIGAFTVEDQKLVEILAQHVSSAISRIRHLESERTRQVKLEALHRHAVKLSGVTTLKEIGETTFKIIEDVFGFSYGGFAAVKDDNLLTEHIQGMDVGKNIEIPLDGPGITVRAVKTGQTQLVRDTRIDPDYIKVVIDGRTSLSEIAVPVIVDGKVMALINVESPKIDDFTEEDQYFLEIMAMHVSSTIKQIQHLEQVQVMERTKAREAVENAAKLSSIVRHDLRGPLSAIRNATYILRGELGNAEVLNIIDRSASRATEILEELRERTWTGSINPVSTDLVALTKETLEGLGAPDGVTVETRFSDEAVYGQVDGAKIRRVVDNLVLNAFDAMPDGGRLTVEEWVKDGALVLRISDSGVGIPSESLAKLFSPYYTTKVGGMGLGLTYCRQVVEAHGGTITVESEVGRGTCVTVKLPLGSLQTTLTSRE